jgi:flagellar hook-associated protein 3 FlgL
MISRIGTFSNANILINASLKTQAKLADLQAQESSGLKSTAFSGVGGDAAKLLNLSGQSARLTADNAAATGAGAVVQGAYSAVSNIADLAATVRSQLASAVSGANGGSAVLAETAKNWLSELQSELNTQVGGVYVFAGTASDTAPVDFASPTYVPVLGSAPDTGYYAGSTNGRVLTTSQGVTTRLGALASDPGFAKLANALSLIAANPGNAATLQSAYDQVSSATSDLSASQAAISSQASSLDSLVTGNQAKITTLDNLATDIDGADLATAAVRVTQYETQLDALYSTISKLSALSILKYL